MSTVNAGNARIAVRVCTARSTLYNARATPAGRRTPFVRFDQQCASRGRPRELRFRSRILAAARCSSCRRKLVCTRLSSSLAPPHRVEKPAVDDAGGGLRRAPLARRRAADGVQGDEGAPRGGAAQAARPLRRVRVVGGARRQRADRRDAAQPLLLDAGRALRRRAQGGRAEGDLRRVRLRRPRPGVGRVPGGVVQAVRGRLRQDRVAEQEGGGRRQRHLRRRRRHAGGRAAAAAGAARARAIRRRAILERAIRRPRNSAPHFGDARL